MQVVGGSQQLSRIATFIQYIQSPSNHEFDWSFYRPCGRLTMGCETQRQKPVAKIIIVGII